MRVVADIEANGFLEEDKNGNPPADRIWCFCAKDIDTMEEFTFLHEDIEEMKVFLSGLDYLIGHNFFGYDLPLLSKLYGIDWCPYSLVGKPCKIVDTLSMSQHLYSDRATHGLDGWGKVLGVDKPPVDDWVNLGLETYIHRCKEDVQINYLLYLKLINELNRLLS